MNTKFVEIISETVHEDGYRHRWTEWFCLAETWTHPYNARDEKAKAFRRWCDNQDAYSKWGSCCPPVLVGGAPLNDGWGSDIAARHCGIVGADDDATVSSWCDMIEDVLLSGKPREFDVEGPRGKTRVKAIPHGTVAPDESSLKEFGPWEDDVRASIVAANVLGSENP